MRILVTGSRGFVGTNLMVDLAAEQCQVEEMDLKIRDYNQDICHLAQIPCSVNSIVHLAALTGVLDSKDRPAEYVTTNVLGTLNILRMAQESMARVVYISTGGADGCQNPYAASKLGGEALCRAFAQSYGLETVILRLSNVYGPHSRHKTSAIAVWCKATIAGEPLIVYGDGSQTRDFVYVGDVVAAIRWALSAPARDVAGNTYRVCSGVRRPVTDVLDVLEDARQGEDGVALEIDFRDARKGEVVHPPEIDAFGTAPVEYTSLERGLERTFDWFWQQAQEE